MQAAKQIFKHWQRTPGRSHWHVLPTSSVLQPEQADLARAFSPLVGGGTGMQSAGDSTRLHPARDFSRHPRLIPFSASVSTSTEIASDQPQHSLSDKTLPGFYQVSHASASWRFLQYLQELTIFSCPQGVSSTVLGSRGASIIHDAQQGILVSDPSAKCSRRTTSTSIRSAVSNSSLTLNRKLLFNSWPSSTSRHFAGAGRSWPHRLFCFHKTQTVNNRYCVTQSKWFASLRLFGEFLPTWHWHISPYKVLLSW